MMCQGLISPLRCRGRKAFHPAVSRLYDSADLVCEQSERWGVLLARAEAAPAALKLPDGPMLVLNVTADSARFTESHPSVHDHASRLLPATHRTSGFETSVILMAENF